MRLVQIGLGAFGRSWLPVVRGATGVALVGDWATHDRETSWNGDWEITGDHGRLLWRDGETDATTGEILAQVGDEPLSTISMPE